MPRKQIEWPDFTITPNIIYVAMPCMKESELKVTLAITRVTFGWHEERERLTLADIMALTGLSKPSAVDGIKDGMLRGLIDRERSGNTFYYFLAMAPAQSVKNLVSEAKALQLKNLTAEQQETVKKFNPPPTNKKRVKESAASPEASARGKNSDDDAAASRDERAAQARRLFERWKEIFGESNAIWTEERRELAEERLEQFPFETLERCLLGVLGSDHHMGRNPRSNPRGLVWNRFEWILKKPERVEQFDRMYQKQITKEQTDGERSGGGTGAARGRSARGRAAGDGRRPDDAGGGVEPGDLKVDRKDKI